MAKNVKKSSNKSVNKNMTNKTTKRKSYADEKKMYISPEVKSNLIVVGVVVLILVLFYIISVYATGGSLFGSKSKSKENVEFQYNEILLGRSFDMGGNYYVVYYDMSDEEDEKAIELDGLVSTFRNKSGDAAIYTCDLGNVFNKPFVTTEEPNTNPYGAEDMLINGPTLIRFSEGKVEEYIYGYDDVANFMNSFTGEEE